MAFEDTALLYLAATLGAALVTYVAAEIFNTLTANRAINAITNTTSVGINAVLSQHTSSTVSTHSLSSQSPTSTTPPASASAKAEAGPGGIPTLPPAPAGFHWAVVNNGLQLVQG